MGPHADVARIARDALHRFLAERSRDLLLRVTPHGAVIEASAAAKAILGVDPERLVGRSMFDLVHADDLPLARATHAALLADSAEHTTTLRVRRSDGSFVWLEFHAKAMRDDATGQILELVSTARDVTERRLAELAMAESERRFRATFEQAAVGVSHHALDGRWLRVNQRLCEITGYAREELLGRDFRSLTHPDDRDADGAGAAALLSGDIAVHRREERVVRKDGSLVWANLTMSLVRREDGAPDYFLAVVEDISARKRWESDLAMARRELAQMEKLSALGTLVGGVAHELRTPLTYASNHLYLLERRLRQAHERPLSDKDLTEMQDGVTEALAGIERINRLVQDLRRFASRDRAQRVVARVDEAVRDALDLFEATHRGRHTVAASVEPLPPMPMDRVQIQQIVLNLLENAADAMPGGGQIDVATRLEGREALVIVTDHGDGIPIDVQERLFQPFQTTKTHGMGLGLSIVKRIVEAHGGRIDFATRQGRGTTFTVRLAVPDSSGA